MRFLVTLALVIFSVLKFDIAAAEGKAGTFSGFTKYEKYHSDYAVNVDGTHTETHEVVLEVLTDEGIDSANMENISYSEGLEGIEILSAYTLKKDGRRIDVPAENIQERAAMASGGPMFSDIKTKAIVFPDVATGDKVGYSYRLTQKTALFPGHFSLVLAFGRFTAYDDVRVSVSVPVDTLKLRVLASGVGGGRLEDMGGRARWAWTFKNKEIIAPEYGAIDPLDHSPRIIVSSFKDYGELAAAYDRRARPTAAVTAKVRKLADEITGGAKDGKEQARLLYNWVSQNISYAGNCIGVGTVVPHDTDAILANKLGDCKDHTTLLQALLAAKGIESTPALVNFGSVYNLPEVPSTAAFNHVINYIPSLDIYADATIKFAPFGMLPPNESGKPAIHTSDFKGVRKTPVTDYRSNRSRTKTVLNFNEDGSAEGETSNEETGIFAVGVRAAFAYMQPQMEDLAMRSILSRSGSTGTGKIIKADARELSESYSYGGEYHLDDAMALPGPGALHIMPVFPNAAPVASALDELNIPDRTLDYGCFGGVAIEEYTLNLPKNVEIISLPKGVSITEGHVSYESSYRLNGSTVTVKRRLEDRAESICTPEDSRKFKPVAKAILNDLKAPILYK